MILKPFVACIASDLQQAAAEAAIRAGEARPDGYGGRRETANAADQPRLPAVVRDADLRDLKEITGRLQRLALWDDDEAVPGNPGVAAESGGSLDGEHGWSAASHRLVPSGAGDRPDGPTSLVHDREWSQVGYVEFYFLLFFVRARVWCRW